MNREIEFRGKRTDSGEWVYGYYASIEGQNNVWFSWIIPSESEVEKLTIYESCISGAIEVHPDTVKIEVCGQWFSEKELSDIVKKGLTSDNE